MLNQFVKSCCPWEGPTLVKWRTVFIGGTPCWSRKTWGGESNWDNWLLADHNPHSPSICDAQEEEAEKSWASLIIGRTEGWGDVVICFSLCCFSSPYSIFSWQKRKINFTQVESFMNVADEWSSCLYLDSHAFPSNFLLSCWGGE